MQAVGSFFSHLVADINAASTNRIPNEELQNTRIGSIFFRVVGACAAATVVIATVNLLAGAITPGAFLVGALFFGVLAHETIRVGYNLRKTFAGLDKAFNPNASIFTAGLGLLSAGVDILGAAGKEGYRSTPYYLHDTVLLEPIYKALNGL